MIKNLVPDFMAALEAADPLEAYLHYIDDHLPVLNAYWHNYILDLDSPHAEDIMRRALQADRRDLQTLTATVDLVALADETLMRCVDLFHIDSPVDIYLMVGVGGANAGELVVAGRGIAFVCLEHFTGRANPETLGLGLSPDLLPLWIAHEVAHNVRYCSPNSEGEMRRLVREMNGNYDYWETGSRAALRELLVNEGLAVAASKKVAPGFEPWDYLGYRRRQYRRLRELEAFLAHHLEDEMESTGLGFRLRYLSGGMSPAQRLLAGKVIPERSGYYVGLRMVEATVAARGIAKALRTSAEDCRELEARAAGRTA
jgi:hypothetical protein